MRCSIVIAAHNEGEALWRTVQSCVETAGGLDYEIVVADDHSCDDSIEELRRRFPRVRVVRHGEPKEPGPFEPGILELRRRGTSPTKDFGAQEARGDVLVFLDAHCKPEAGAIKRLVESVEHLDGAAIVTPRVAALDVSRWTNTPSQVGHGYFLDLEQFHCGWLPLSELRGVDHRCRRFYESPALIGCALAVHRELYERLRGFDPQMRSWGVEDLDFGLKCWLMGFPILHDPEATIGHRFRGTFDNYSVPFEHLIVNQLRMAYKNFTRGTWSDWVNRCRERHASKLFDHPEGLWARVWSLFESQKPSVQFERSYLLSQRVRDEFWYAERFGLSWPRLHSAAFAPGASLFAEEPSPSPSPPPPARRTILLLGYWPPTDIGIATRPGMLWKWREKKAITLEGKTYDVLAISPTFNSRLGTYPPPAFNEDYWGKGTGTLTVDYRATSTDFWSIVKTHRPIAIMSFSRWTFTKEWALDAWATNWARDQAVPALADNKFWLLALDYKDNDGVAKTQTWEKPFIGGAADDPSPFKGDGAIKYNPPDRTKDALSRRDSNLPMTEIKAAVDTAFTDDEIKPIINDTIGPGRFVSNFLAYHDPWYREWWSTENNDPKLACLRAGHTHVGGQITVTNAEKAVEIQLKELFKVLPAT